MVNPEGKERVSVSGLTLRRVIQVKKIRCLRNDGYPREINKDKSRRDIDTKCIEADKGTDIMDKTEMK